MKTSLALGLCLFAFGCGRALENGQDPMPTHPGTPPAPPTPVITHPNPVVTGGATLENGLPYDACTWLIRLDGDVEGAYGPDAASAPLIQAFAGDKIGETRAQLEYELTGDKVDIECGWGGKTAVDALHIVAVKAP